MKCNQQSHECTVHPQWTKSMTIYVNPSSRCNFSYVFHWIINSTDIDLLVALDGKLWEHQSYYDASSGEQFIKQKLQHFKAFHPVISWENSVTTSPSLQPHCWRSTDLYTYKFGGRRFKDSKLGWYYTLPIHPTQKFYLPIIPHFNAVILLMKIKKSNNFLSCIFSSSCSSPQHLKAYHPRWLALILLLTSWQGSTPIRLAINQNWSKNVCVRVNQLLVPCIISDYSWRPVDHWSLRSVYLHNNKLTDAGLPDQMFNGSDNLEIITMSSNFLRVVPKNLPSTLYRLHLKVQCLLSLQSKC